MSGNRTPFFSPDRGTNMEAKYCLIPGLVLVAVAGLVQSLGEDLDRPLFGPPGSPVKLRDSDPGLKKAVLFAEERYNLGTNAMHLRRVSRIISASKQVAWILCAL